MSWQFCWEDNVSAGKFASEGIGISYACIWVQLPSMPSPLLTLRIPNCGSSPKLKIMIQIVHPMDTVDLNLHEIKLA